MAETITWDVLRSLAGFHAGDGHAISIYVNLDPRIAPTQRDVATRISALLAQAQRRAESRRDVLTRTQREGVRADLERIGGWFENGFDRNGSHGAVVFADGPDGLFDAYTLPRHVPDEVKLGSELYLAPLLDVVTRSDGAIVAYVGRERAQVFRLDAGRLVAIADASDDVPGRHDQGGWSQARYERHIETIVERHLRRAADTLAACVRAQRGAALVLVGAEEIRPEFEELLASEVRECVVGWTTAEAHSTPAELLAAAEPVLERWRTGREEQVLARWREAAGREGRASSGWERTLEAASDGRVELLLVQQGVDRPAYRCPRCGRVQTANGACPLDGAALERDEDGLDLALHRTLEHGGAVTLIRAQRDLDPVEGIGALLRFWARAAPVPRPSGGAGRPS
jgi:peptide chain release factor subunit 1